MTLEKFINAVVGSQEGNVLSPQRKMLRYDKLIDATDLSGEKNEKVFEISSELKEKLSTLPGFIGVFPFGSSVKGYNGEKRSSDYDMEIIMERNHIWREQMDSKLEEIEHEFSDKGIELEFIVDELSTDDFIDNGNFEVNLGIQPPMIYGPFAAAAALCA